MRVLMLNAYFYPEQIAFTHLEKDLLDAFVEEGFEIDVITPIPTRGIDDVTCKKYARIKEEVFYEGKVKVHRFWAPQEGRNPIARAFRYFWCNLREYQIGMKYRDTDVIFCTSTPPTQGWIAGKVKESLQKQGNKDVRFVYNLQDIFPDSMVNAGMTKKGSLLWKIGRRIEDRIYKNADKVITISESCKKNVYNKGVPEEKVELISNWIDLDDITFISKNENQLFNELNIDRSKFIVLYAGNMGETQQIDVIIDVAEKLKDYKDIHFILFGFGSRYENIKSKAEKLKNVFMHPLLPVNRVSEVYSMANLALIACKKGTGNAGLPSKLWTIMACNVPILGIFDTNSDLSRHVENSRAGMCVEPGNSDAASKYIMELFMEYSNGNDRSINSRGYVKSVASKEICTKKYVEVIYGR